jgi:selenocysteine-specific elongation factor
VIVATAGHIDHGKTALVKALTGVDTDRLPEEKARGISIDVGFAYWRAPGGALVGFVDVPGHERFVHNMLAGVCGIDFVMLLVAADDGVMPQTREHLDIVDLLGIRHGVLVVTKCDRVDDARVREVSHDVRELVAGTALAHAPLVVTSAASGAGIPAVRELLANAAGSAHGRRTASRRFRFAVDRAFTVVGSGTVVTGTVFDGTVRTGDRLVLSPSGVAVRVRGLQKAGEAADTARAGERCALNLVGVERSQAHRGDWVMDPALHAPGEALDVELRVLASCKQGLRHYTPVHLHLGTQDVNARVLLRRGTTIAPGETAFARIVADRPVSALHGDRFILRDQSAQRTLAGGVVLDAFPPRRRAPVGKFVERMQALSLDPAGALGAVAAASDTGEDAAVFCRNFNLTPDFMARIVADGGLALVAWPGGRQSVVTQARAHALELASAPREVPENPEHRRLWELAQMVLARSGGAAMTLAAIAQETGAKEAVLQDVLHRRAAGGDAVRIAGDRFLLRAAFDAYARIAQRVAAAAEQGRFTAADFRDAAGVGRGFAIQLLEAMDRLGITRRIGDVRVMLGRTGC